MPFGITPLHVIVVLIIVLIVLGPRGLPKVGSALGKSLREFRHAVPAARDAFTSEAETRPSGSAPGKGTVAGTKVGSVAGRSVRGFRDALSETGHAFVSEVSPTPPEGPPSVSVPVEARPPSSGDGPSLSD